MKKDSEQRELGDFELIREIGRGGMGIVYEAHQRSLNRRVALKVLPATLGVSARVLQRFRREAESAAKLHHTNIVPVFAVAEDQGTHYYAMELIEGPSLDRIIKEMELSAGATTEGAASRVEVLSSYLADSQATVSTSTPVLADESSSDSFASSSGLHAERQYFDTVAKMIADVAEALAYAHDRGVIHRDIKPSNLLLAPDARLYITDFGLARVLDRQGLTVTGEFMGTPRYMSPEQVTAGRIPLDHRTDIYSLGASLYELLTLQPPFSGERRDQVLSQIIHKEPRPPRRINKRIPVDLETVCLKALEKDPDQRYQTAEQLADDLRRYLNRHAISARKVGLLGKSLRWVQRNRSLACALLVVGLLMLGVGWLGYRANKSEVARRQSEDRANESEERAQRMAVRHAMDFAMRAEEEAMEKAIRDASNAGVSEATERVIRGLFHVYMGNSALAIDECREALKLQPARVAPHAVLVFGYGQSGDEVSLVKALVATRELKAEQPIDHLLKAAALMGTAPIAAKESVDQAIVANEEFGRKTYMELITRGVTNAFYAFDTGDRDVAMVALAEVAEALDENENAFSTAAIAIAELAAAHCSDGQERQRHLDSAEATADRIVNEFSNSRFAIKWAAVSYAQTGRVADAVSCFRNVLRMSNGGADGARGAAFIILHGDPEEAERLMAGTDSPLGVIALALLRSKLDSPEAAIALLEERVSLFQSGLGFAVSAEQTLQMLKGKRDKTAFNAFRDLPAARKWNKSELAHAAGEISNQQLLDVASVSARETLEAHWNIALVSLAERDIPGARRHLTEAWNLRYVPGIDHAVWAELLLKWLEDDWPSWNQGRDRK